jgi:3-oxoadipate enol-lactonase
MRFASSIGKLHPMAMRDQTDHISGEPRLNWVRTGTEHAETVILIHAVGYDLTYWDRQIDALQADYNVVAFDLPGHGRSPGEARDWSFDYAAATVAGLIEHASDKSVHLVGISFGGMIAQATVLARPELVLTLTLIGTASTFPEPVRQGMRARAQAVRTGGMEAVLQSSLERWFTPETRARRPDIIDRVSKTILADDPDVHAAIWDIVSHFEVHDRLAEIKSPPCLGWRTRPQHATINGFRSRREHLRGKDGCRSQRVSHCHGRSTRRLEYRHTNIPGCSRQ